MEKMRIVTGGLSAAAALAAGSGAYANIVVVAPPANLPTAASPTTAPVVNWDINGDATTDFVFQFRNPQAAGTGVQWQANMNPFAPAGIQAVAGFAGPFINYGSKLATGAVIGPVVPAPASAWENTAQVCLGSFYRSGSTVTGYGGFVNGSVASSSVVRGFVGFRFSVAGNTRYGWLDVEVRGSGTAANSGGIFFFGAAYEDSGATIPAGAVPAPGSLAALALGAVGCLRRKRCVA